MDALTRFQQEFRRWVTAHNAKGFDADPDELLRTLSDRITEDTQRQIGAALVNGWLVTERQQGRGYMVRESDRPGQAGGQYMVTHGGGGSVVPCWELYVQLADYSRLRTAAEPRGLTVRLEDHQMDITVWAGEEFLLYVENKTTEAQARALLRKVQEYGEAGFSMDLPDRGNDPLRKAKYLFSRPSRPRYLGLSALGYERLFRIGYGDADNRFRLVETGDPITAPLREAVAVGKPPGWHLADALLLEVDRLVGDRLWVSPGTGQTAYNLYLPTDSQDAIAIGIYENGQVYTDCSRLGERRSRRLSGGLSGLDIELDPSKTWTWWRRGDSNYELQEDDLVGIAEVLAGLIADEDQPGQSG